MDTRQRQTREKSELNVPHVRASVSCEATTAGDVGCSNLLCSLPAEL